MITVQSARKSKRNDNGASTDEDCEDDLTSDEDIDGDSDTDVS